MASLSHDEFGLDEQSEILFVDRKILGFAHGIGSVSGLE